MAPSLNSQVAVLIVILGKTGGSPDSPPKPGGPRNFPDSIEEHTLSSASAGVSKKRASPCANRWVLLVSIHHHAKAGPQFYATPMSIGDTIRYCPPCTQSLSLPSILALVIVLSGLPAIPQVVRCEVLREKYPSLTGLETLINISKAYSAPTIWGL